VDIMLETIIEMQFGSHVYGTNLPSSDLDIKGVFLPSGRDIILQRVKNSVNETTKVDERAKNSSNDRDYEAFSLQRYLKLLLEGQTVALDMLFTPKKFWLKEHEYIWNLIVENKHKFLHSNVLSFVNYCRTQANKYGIKGSRMRAVKDSVDILSQLNKRDTLKQHINVINTMIDSLNFLKDIEDNALVKMTSLFNKKEARYVAYLEICGRKFELGITIKDALDRLHKIYDEYGLRARQAENNNGIDWKALCHALRIQHEAKELLSTGNITFPRPEKELLLSVRKGELQYKKVAEMIENGLEELVEIQKNSILPKTPDYAFAEELVYNQYIIQVNK
jgi:predicted nucleotidyltransferase